MKISIRWALILGCLGLIWGLQILITSTSYVSSQKVLLGHARDIMQNIADLTMTQSENHLRLAHGAAHLTKRLMTSNVVGSDDERHGLLEKYFLDQLSLYPHFAGIYVGLANGDFFYVSRTNARSPDGFRTKQISHPGGRRQTRLIWRDSHGTVLADEIDPSDTYDPRQRPWYLKATAENRIIWTDPYIFFTSQNPGITTAGPIYRNATELQGVVGVDIEIDELSTFISKLRIGKNGRAFMINSNGEVVAFPDLDKLRRKDDSQTDRYRMVKIEEMDDGLSKAAYAAIQWSRSPDGRLFLDKPQFAKFGFGGKTYHTMFTPFTNTQWPWIIGVYLPEDDYLGSIKANRRNNYLIALAFSVIVTLIGLRLARNIVRPLVGLEKAALAIKQHDLTQHFDTRSAFKEIAETADAFDRMKVSMQTSEEKYRRIFENIQDVYWESSISGTILEISPSIEKVSGYTREELIGTSLDRIYVDPGDREGALSRILESGKLVDHEVKLRNKDGGIEYCSITATVKYDASGKPDKCIGSLRVITDRKKADLELRRYQDHLEVLVQDRTLDLKNMNDQMRDEIKVRKEKEEALRRSEEKYRSIIEKMENGYYEMDLEGKLTFFNNPLVEILGYPKDEMPGLSFRSYLSEETVQLGMDKFSAVRRTGMRENMLRNTIVRKDGTQRIVEASVALITDHAGRPMGYRGVITDITDRLQAEEEKRKFEERFQQIQRLEGIGTLAGGVAHDFNNLLMGIQGNVSLMLLDTDSANPRHERLKSIEKCVSAGAELTRQLLGFARGGKYMVKALDFNEIVKNTAQMFGRTRKEINMVEKIDTDLWTVMADQSQIEQVLLNIYINAWQAMPDGGNIYVETKNVVLNANLVRPFNIRAGRYVRVAISDTGVGMDQTIQRRIFEPFFTTKEMGRGTGLGLASAYGIIKNHDGAIDFVSRKGEGTTFYIYLPASQAEVEEEPASINPVETGSETILLVDDEEVVLDVNQPMLESLGYTVITALGGVPAMDIFSRSAERIDMVVLDMIMPDLGGGLVFDRLKAIKPDVKVLLSSGYSLTGQAEEILSRGCSGFIQKPFSIEQLSLKIREILDG
jgi:two-component system cell cycle sensor histidine kinase/response regulator CckA